ncbi:hypothetical protein RUND412_007956 [Rhizina undulata]
MSSATPAVLEADRDLSVDLEYDDCDYESSFESDTTSLITAARNHTFENGRRYHGYEWEKGEIHHAESRSRTRPNGSSPSLLLASTSRRINVAPVGKDWNPHRILDVGSGSGIWAIDMADQYQGAHIIGTDLSPIQPHWVPPNASFEVDDLEETWQYQDNSFDFIFIQQMAGAIHD